MTTGKIPLAFYITKFRYYFEKKTSNLRKKLIKTWHAAAKINRYSHS